MEKYDKLCNAPDCFTVVKEADVERGISGEVYERSKTCYGCRTEQDNRAVKRFRKATNKKKREQHV